MHHLVSKTRLVEGTVISAVHQYAGRGQVGKAWFGTAGKNIAMSVILYPRQIDSQYQFQLNKLLSVSLVRYLRPLTGKGELTIKWPNDILIDDRKVAGLLIQVASSGVHLKHAIFGIGINVFEDAFPAELSDAVSLVRYNQNLPELTRMIEMVRDQLLKDYTDFLERDWLALDSTYEELLFGRNRKLSFSTRYNDLFEGLIRGVDEQGRLVLETSGGVRSFQTGELVFGESVK